MGTGQFQLPQAAAMALVLMPLLTESASAQLFRRFRRVPPAAERYEWSVPVQSSEIAAPAAPTFTIHALLPTAEAELWVDGARKVSSGNTRTVEFTPNRLDGRSQYVVEALWSQGGQVIKDTRVVDAYPGDRITIDFTRPGLRSTPTEIVPREVPGPK